MKINGATALVSTVVGVILMLGSALAWIDATYVRAGDFSRLETQISDIQVDNIERELFTLRRDLQTPDLPATVKAAIERRIAVLERKRNRLNGQ